MKSLLVPLALLGLASSATAQAQVGQPAPELRGRFTKLAESSLAELRGRVVLIEFWRTW